MKKILQYISLAALFFTACTEEELPIETGANPDGTFTFNLSLDTPADAQSAETAEEIATRGKATVARYLLEMYEGDLTATPVKMNNTTGTFDVTMKKGVDYICLFWADGGDKEYTATNLKAVTQTTPANVGKPAYYGKVTTNTTDFNGTVTLKRAVAEVNFLETTGFTTADNTLTVKYPITGAAFNVADGTVANFGTGAEITRRFTGIAATAKDGLLATDYLLAPATQTAMNGIKIKFNEFDEKTLTATPLRANFKTNINGKYDNTPPAEMTFTIDLSAHTDKTYVLPFAETGSTGDYTLTIDWGDGSTATTIPAGTDLSTPEAATLLTHNTYAQQKTYQITVTSSQSDGTKPQMPYFIPGTYRTSGNNKQKISSMDSPMLNTGIWSFYEAFKGCTGLKTIHADLFANHVAVTSFQFCFYGCSSLTALPEGLFASNTAVTSFQFCFSGCSSLTALPEGLFAKNVAVTNFESCFSGCLSLTALPEGLFAKNTAALGFYRCFSGCSSLTALPEGLFAKNTAALGFLSCFYGCSSLTALPEGLFASNTAVTDFTSCFSVCSSLTALPEGLFANNLAVTTFKSCFRGCSSLTALPEGLFASNTAVTDFQYCFYECSSLTALPEGLFASNTAVTDFQCCFYGCSSLTALPEGLFASNTAVTTFQYCFNKCSSLTALPEGLFASNTAVTTFQYCFNECSSLTSLPEGLFASNTAVTNFASCFNKCSSLTSLPEGLFASNTAVTNFASCFYRCSALTSIPEGLFVKNVAVTTFQACFYECKALTSLPEGLFVKNTAALGFLYCFYGCSSLTALPEGLFASNTAVTNFDSCFGYCSSLTSLPEGLFNNNTAATNFSGCFNECNKLKLNDKIFSTTGDKNRFSGKVMNFANCFKWVGFQLSNISDSKAPDLWNYDGAATWTKTGCFINCRVSNWGDIPADWK